MINKERFDAVLFDLDGVLTPTAKVHARAWKQMFDEFTAHWNRTHRPEVAPFDIGMDYLEHVDGKPRYDGVRGFLASRGIDLPYGEPADPPGLQTVCALGNRKDVLVKQVLASEPLEAFPTSVRLVEWLRAEGIRTAVVSSSRNCQAVLRAAGIEHLFDARVDGVIAGERQLKGKPAPDTFLAAAEEVGASAARTVVVEDAGVGVQAGRAGGFGLVIGVARHGDAAALKRQGADLVVADLGELL